jgi:hypothetical protein
VQLRGKERLLIVMMQREMKEEEISLAQPFVDINNLNRMKR